MEDEFNLPFVEFDDIWPTEEPEEAPELRHEDNRQIVDQFKDILDVSGPSKGANGQQTVRTSDSGPSGGGNLTQMNQRKQVHFADAPSTPIQAQPTRIQEPLTPISLNQTPEVTNKRRQQSPE